MVPGRSNLQWLALAVGAKTQIWLFEHLTANSTPQASVIMKLMPLAVLENNPLLRYPIIEHSSPNYASSRASTRLLLQRVRCRPVSYRRAPESLAQSENPFRHSSQQVATSIPFTLKCAIMIQELSFLSVRLREVFLNRIQ